MKEGPDIARMAALIGDPARANILYNSLVREQLARRNAEIAAENAMRRRQVKLGIVPQPVAGRKP